MSVTCERQCHEPLGAKRETVLVLYNDFDAQHSDDEVILLVGLRRYDAHLFLPVSDARATSSSLRRRLHVTHAPSHARTLLYPTLPHPAAPYPSTSIFPCPTLPLAPPFCLALLYPRHLHFTVSSPILGTSMLPCPSLL